jgi:endoglucanase
MRMLSPAHQVHLGGTDCTGASALDASEVTTQNQIAPGPLHTQGNQIVDNTGAPVRIIAVNWTGFQSEAGVVDGLWNSDPNYNRTQSGGRNWMDMMNQMQQLGFSIIRLPLSSDILTSSPKQDSIDYGNNSDLQGPTRVCRRWKRSSLTRGRSG